MSLQRTPAWFAAREGKLTCSTMGMALGINPWTSRIMHWKRLTGNAEPFTGNVATDWGTKQEPVALEEYSYKLGNPLTEVGFVPHPYIPWIGGSPDGMIGDNGMIEMKCPFSKRLQETIPTHYYPQVNGLLEVTETEWCDFVSWTPEGMNVVRIKRNPEAFEWLLAKYKVFWEHVSKKQEPPKMSQLEKDTINAKIKEFIDIDTMVLDISHTPDEVVVQHIDLDPRYKTVHFPKCHTDVFLPEVENFSKVLGKRKHESD